MVRKFHVLSCIASTNKSFVEFCFLLRFKKALSELGLRIEEFHSTYYTCIAQIRVVFRKLC